MAMTVQDVFITIIMNILNAEVSNGQYHFKYTTNCMNAVVSPLVAYHASAEESVKQ